MDNLPFELAAEDFLSPEDVAKLEKMSGEVFSEFSKLSLEEMRQSPIFLEIEAFMRSIVETMRDYYSIHRLIVDNYGKITVFSYCAFMGSDPEENTLDQLGIRAYSSKSVHVIIPMHEFKGMIFNAIYTEALGVGIPCAGTLFYPTAPEDGHTLSKLERSPEIITMVAAERESYQEEAIGRGNTF